MRYDYEKEWGHPEIKESIIHIGQYYIEFENNMFRFLHRDFVIRHTHDYFPNREECYRAIHDFNINLEYQGEPHISMHSLSEGT